MFSGIIADIGSIKQATDRDGGVRLVISAKALDLSDVQIGDSIAVNGVCLTVIEHTNDAFTVDVSRETLDCTVGLDAQGAPVNLEKALRLADRLGGHLVSGHVDGVGEVVTFTDLGESWKLVIRAPHVLAKYIAIKGSITVNGVSLTINRVSVDEFSVNLIPHTLVMTNLKNLRAGSRVNLEVDLIARYVERMMQKETL
ncbi:MAG: riboflavin synthase subunit alpha [Betaproteobacteria bacterium RBG_16_56_24]|nr:MAG: riboflavin synthase subunit alpha [Betaproteobacteria bacterium RBG_16_56_24]